MNIADNHWMVDIETFATSNNALILSIGIVNITDPMRKQLLYPSIIEQLLNGAEVDKRTCSWWSTQSEAAIDGLYSGPSGRMDIKEVHSQLQALLSDPGKPVLWAKPPQFDLTILKNMFTRSNLNHLWCHSKEICLRTFFKCHYTKGPKINRDCHHNALDDAFVQALQVRELLEMSNELFERS